MSSYPFFIPEFVLCANSSLFSFKIANEPSEFRNYLIVIFTIHLFRKSVNGFFLFSPFFLYYSLLILCFYQFLFSFLCFINCFCININQDRGFTKVKKNRFLDSFLLYFLTLFLLTVFNSLTYGYGIRAQSVSFLHHPDSTPFRFRCLSFCASMESPNCL